MEDDDIQEIDLKIKEPISGETIFEEFINQIQWNQEAVTVQNPYTPAHIVSMAFANIEKCGLYQDDFQEWSRKWRLYKTWINFKAHFARACKETQRSDTTSKTEGCADNVQSAQSNTVLFTEMQQDHTMTLENIATATQADKTLVALLTKTIAELLTQVTTLTANLAMAQSENACLKRPVHCLSNAGAPADRGHSLANVGTPANHNPPRDRNIYSRSGQKFDPNGYFSYHGFKVEETHTSATCTRPLNDPKKLETRLDTKVVVQWNNTWFNVVPTK